MKKLLLLLAIPFLAFTNPQQNFKALLQLTGAAWQMKTPKGYTCEKWKKISDTELNGLGV